MLQHSRSSDWAWVSQLISKYRQANRESEDRHWCCTGNPGAAIFNGFNMSTAGEGSGFEPQRFRDGRLAR